MPRKGTITGASLDNPNRGKKGGLTGSKRVTGETTTNQVTETTSDTVASNTPQIDHIKGDETPEQAEARRNRLAEKLQQGGQVIGTVGQVVGTVVTKTNTAVQSALNHNPGSLTDGTVDTAAILAKADANIDSSVPELDSGEAIRRNIVIARQRNYVGVAINNTKLKQDLATLDLEQQKLIGLLIDGKTAGINNEKKAVQYQRAVVGRDTELSRLEQDEELLVQQRIRTTGTQQQTEHIQQQENLKVEMLREQVEKQKYEIQNVQYEKEKIKQEAVAKFAAGF
ncbi:hypothetical protein F7734_48925 [Scytonema sp. UIC 10036]|uniref:hypothetical protein n=1 Tax=Scytonema sp. UIC 10036 TaxID=2304196 RepID=UPI0012DA7754|nr:hypothetical protein [Scytonema sp. UIC 10036]MUG99782.1 hypothetical protein [Scytonema sp. UIC 10036]